MQVAYAYNFLPGTAAGGPRILERRLRIQTLKLAVAKNIDEVYKQADQDMVVQVLMHKLSQSALKDGNVEARLLLQDWLTILYCQYNKMVLRAQLPVDLTFAKYSNLFFLPRLVFGLLKSQLLGEAVVSDYWHALYSVVGYGTHTAAHGKCD